MDRPPIEVPIPVVKIERKAVKRPNLRHHDPLWIHLIGDASAAVAIITIASPLILIGLAVFIAAMLIVFT